LGFSGCGAALCHFNEKIYLTIRFVEGHKPLRALGTILRFGTFKGTRLIETACLK
jgi:hypothetical protein